MTRIVLAITVLALATLACGEYVATVTPTPPAASPPPSPTAPPSATPAATATATEAADAGVQTAIVRQPVVNVRDAAGGVPTGAYVYAGDTLTVLEVDGDWARIAEPPGWVWAGCLEGLSDRGCVAE
jgi:hypothetical protein